jgi:hypothetical protein
MTSGEFHCEPEKVYDLVAALAGENFSADQRAVVNDLLEEFGHADELLNSVEPRQWPCHGLPKSSAAADATLRKAARTNE